MTGARYCGLDIRPFSPAIKTWVDRLGLADKVHFVQGSQDDPIAIQDVQKSIFGGRPIDLIIDDASHMYDLSRRTFEITFPIVSRGGLYLLEDWSWAHANGPAWQTDRLYGDRPALSNLVFELAMLAASQPTWTEGLLVETSFALLQKSNACPALASFKMDDYILKQGRRFEPI